VVPIVRLRDDLYLAISLDFERTSLGGRVGLHGH